jgi:hypothetical protein
MSPLGRARWLLALTVLAYAPIAVNGFVLEDAHVRQPAGQTTAGVRVIFSPSRVLAQRLWSTDPRTVHLLSASLHLLIGGLVGVLALQLGITTWWVPMGLVWLHPITVEAVAYGAAQGELLAAVGVLMAVTASLGAGRGSALVVMLVWGVWAMVSKESGVAVVGLLALTVLWRGRTWPTLIAVAALALLALRGLPLVLAINRNESMGAAAWIGWQSVAAWRLVSLTVPFGFSIDHDYTATSSVLRTEAVAGWIAVAAGAGWLLLLRVFDRWDAQDGFIGSESTPRRDGIGFGLAWTLLAMAPRFVVRTPLSIFPEHQWYLPFIGLALALGAACEPPPERFRR